MSFPPHYIFVTDIVTQNYQTGNERTKENPQKRIPSEIGKLFRSSETEIPHILRITVGTWGTLFRLKLSSTCARELQFLQPISDASS